MNVTTNQTLRELRENRRLSQSELAREVGVHRTSVWRIERGMIAPSFSTARRLAAAYGIRLGELYELIEQERQARSGGVDS